MPRRCANDASDVWLWHGMALEIIPVRVRHDIEQGERLERLIAKSGAGIRDGDIVIVSQKAVSKQEGMLVRLSSVIPSMLSAGIASAYGKDPRLVEVILSESKRILRMHNGVIIVETRGGLVCANAGVDESNVAGGSVALLPRDPDASAQRLRQAILEDSGKAVAVIISDTFGRPFRMGQTDCAIGVSGMGAILDYTGKGDMFGRELRVTATAITDELCAAAELVRPKSSRTPMVLVRNYEFAPHPGTAADLLRPEAEDLFR